MVPWSLAQFFACINGEAEDSGAVVSGVDVGDATVCAEPATGFGPYTEESVERGVDVLLGQYEYHPGGVAAGTLAVDDIDGDGDIDLSFPDLHGSPILFENDGNGYFTKVELGLSYYGVANHGLVDIDADGLPDLVLVGIGHVAVARNLGNMAFAQPVAVLAPEYPHPVFATFTAGDVDLDGDIDLVVPGVSWVEEECQLDGTCAGSGKGSPVYVFTNDSGTLTEATTLTPDGVPGFSLAATLTDRDQDGDFDLFVPSDYAGSPQSMAIPPNAFYRNDGVDDNGDVVWVNDADALGVALEMSGMGFATGDYNGDTELDYCVSDVGPMRCFSSLDGAYYDAGVAMGLYEAELGSEWFGWSVEIVDLDNDGILDATATGGRSDLNGTGGGEYQPDLLFHGNSERYFEDVSEQYAFGNDGDDYGAAAADLDGDGVLEIITTPSIGAPKLYHAPCNANAWLAVDLVGPPGNPLGLGARLDLESNGVRYAQEIQGLRGPGQSPSMAWFGLGAAEMVDSLTVTWPGGDRQKFDSIGVRRKITIVHPDGD